MAEITTNDIWGGDLYHVPNPDAKMPPKEFFLVNCKTKKEDGKWHKLAGTFDNKDAALKAAQRAVEAKFEVEVMVLRVGWWKFVPETAGDKEKWEKING